MSIHPKLQAVQSTLEAPKNRTNSFGKYKYRSCEDILEAVKPLLKAHGLTLTISDELVHMPSQHPSRVVDVLDARGNKAIAMVDGDRFYIKATATLADAEGDTVSATAYAREEVEKKGMDASQLTGSTSSYARKYALNGLFLIDDTKDADSNDHPREDAKPTPIANAHQRPAQEEPRALASPAQRNLIIGKWKDLGNVITGEDGKQHHDADALNKALSKKFNENNLTVSLLTSKQASEVIEGLNKTLAERQAVSNG